MIESCANDISCCFVVSLSFSKNMRLSFMDRSVISIIDLFPIFTDSIFGFNRLPWQTGQGDIRMNRSISRRR